MISKEKFCEIINRLKDYTVLQEKINDLFKNQIDNKEMDFVNAGSICIGHETVVVDLLGSIFETDLISWWIYEIDYGKTFEIGDIVELDDGSKPDLTTVENLYDYVLYEYNLKHISSKIDHDENQLANLQTELEIKNKMIDLMAEHLTSPINGVEWVKKYYEERAREEL